MAENKKINVLSLKGGDFEDQSTYSNITGHCYDLDLQELSKSYQQIC